MDWLNEVRVAVDARLTSFFDAEGLAIEESAPDARETVRALVTLTMRGGKRFRPAMLVAAHRAVHADASLDDVLAACAGLEVLQTYLLVHDDWMDGDDERRGGPSVHVLLRRHLRESGHPHASDHLGDALAVLAGDLGCAYANQLVLESAVRTGRVAEAMDVFFRIQRDVVHGQALDLLGSSDVTRMQQLKTGSYTVDGPLALGAVLGGATPVQRDALARYGVPLGEAFQMRDDLLGTFGDPKVTGKPVGNDLRVGKRTALVRELEATVSGPARATFERAFAKPDVDDAALRAAMDVLVESGVRMRVEKRLDALVEGAIDALRDAPLETRGVEQLVALARAIGRRDA